MPRRSVLIALGSCSLAWILACTGCEEPPAKPPAKPPIETRKTLGKTTQNVLELDAALADGGVVTDPAADRQGVDVVTGAHRSASGQIAVLPVEQAMKVYEAEHGERPSTYAEFMEKIMKPGQPDGLQLPMLPYYQEYAFDPEKKGVVVVEFPAKIEQREQETTGAAGL
jgi:hypothetical protein